MLGLHGEATPKAQRRRFLGDRREAPGNGAPLADEDEPGMKGGVRALQIGGGAGAAYRVQIGDLVEDKRA